MYNPDGSPMTDSQKSSEVYDNKTSMANMRGTMSQASVVYSKGDSLLSDLASESNFIQSSPFVLNKSKKQRDNLNSVNAVKDTQRSAVKNANSLSASYDRLVERNDILVNGTVGEQIVKHDQEKREAQSSQAVQLRIQSDPQFSMKYSASVSASASFADLPQSKQSSLLNSYAENERIRKNDNMFGYQGQDLPTGTLNVIQNGTYNEAKNKRGNKK